MPLYELERMQPKHLIIIDSDGNESEVVYRGDNLDIAMKKAYESLNKEKKRGKEMTREKIEQALKLEEKIKYIESQIRDSVIPNSGYYRSKIQIFCCSDSEFKLSREIKLTPSEVEEINKILEKSNKELYEKLEKLRKEYEEL